MMRRPGGHPLPPPVVHRRFHFTKNPYRQLTCVSTVRMVLGVLSIIFAILEMVLRSRYNESWHLAAAGSAYILASILAYLGCAYATWTRHRLLWIHSWISILACLFVYPAEVGVMSLEMCHDTAWCLCAVHPRKPCPQNWPAVPIELAALFVTTVAFVLNLLAAVVSRKMWKTASRLQRLRANACRRASKRNDEEQERIRRKSIIENSNLNNRYGDRCSENDSVSKNGLQYMFVGAAAATAAAAAAAPMFGASRTVVDHLNRPRTLLYPQKDVVEDEESEDNHCALYWWHSPENFV